MTAEHTSNFFLTHYDEELFLYKKVSEAYSLTMFTRLFLKLLNTRYGFQLVQHHLYEHPQAMVEAVRQWSNLHSRLPNCNLPERIRGFQDLVFLFHISRANCGVCLMELDEAAYLYNLIQSLGDCRLAEVGRFKGGSTCIMAAAQQSGTFDSYDRHDPCDYYDGYGKTRRVDTNVYDVELKSVLNRFGLHVNLHVMDSRMIKPEGMYDLVFIDADHSYEGAKRDYEIWEPHIRPGGYILMHDAVNTRPLSKVKAGSLRVANEVPYKRIAAIGSLVVFQK